MDIPNLSKYLVYEDGSLYGKNRGMMLYGCKTPRLFEIFYYISLDDNINKFFRMKKSTLKLMYADELLRCKTT